MANYLEEKAAAEAIIAARKKTRDAMQIEFRTAIAMEAIADDLTRMLAEMSTIRELLAMQAVRR